MTSVQKAIKYLAMAFAIFLTVSIIGGIFTGLAGVSYIFSDHEKDAVVGEMQSYPTDGEISSLSLNLSAADLRIKTSDKFSVESNHQYISVSLNDGKLCIDETKNVFSPFYNNVTVILYVPENLVFDEVQIETDAGEVKIDTLSADVLKLSLGAGETEIKNLSVNSRADIDGGVGELTIDGGTLRNLELEMGVGELTLKSRIEGKCDLDFGIGEANLTILGSREDYQIELDKGIGEAKLEGKSMKDDSVYGAGVNHIEIDGGIGEMNIRFLENEIQQAA